MLEIFSKKGDNKVNRLKEFVYKKSSQTVRIFGGVIKIKNKAEKQKIYFLGVPIFIQNTMTSKKQLQLLQKKLEIIIKNAEREMEQQHVINCSLRKALGLKQNIKIFCMYHYQNKWPLFKSDIYIPLQTGAASTDYDFGCQKDNDGEDNISDKNEYYSALSGLYWVWKNYLPKHPELEYVGIAHHYNQWAFLKPELNARDLLTPITISEFQKIFKEYNSDNVYFADFDVILPKKIRHDGLRGLPFKTSYEQFCYWHPKECYDLFEEILKEKYPQYAQYLSILHDSNEAYDGHLFIMKTDLFNEYMTWLFDILFEEEKSLNGWEGQQKLPPARKRVPENMAERFINVWLAYKQEHALIKLTEIDTYKLIDDLN